MMLLERWVIALMLGVALASTAGAPGQSPPPPAGQNTPQKQSQDTDDAEPAEYHPPAVLGQEETPAPVSPPAPVVSAPSPVSPPAQPVTPKQPPAPPDPPLSKDPVERQLQLDSLHLLQLTEELKAEVAKAGTDTLSLNALRKADQVQQLARSLKERMKDHGQASQTKPN
jgi:hypothetical protein